MIKYFAYGSNMSPAQIAERVGEVANAQPARLEGYELRFNKRSQAKPPCGYANIVPAQEKKVYGVLYDLDENQLGKIDDREGTTGGHYARALVNVLLNNETDVEAVAYVACPEKVEEGLLPTRKYLNHLLAAYKWLPADYLAWLKSHKVKGE